MEEDEKEIDRYRESERERDGRRGEYMYSTCIYIDMCR